MPPPPKLISFSHLLFLVQVTVFHEISTSKFSTCSLRPPAEHKILDFNILRVLGDPYEPQSVSLRDILSWTLPFPVYVRIFLEYFVYLNII
jgi:hypothetical protein